MANFRRRYLEQEKALGQDLLVTGSPLLYELKMTLNFF
mgnify:CR=1 FL=1